MTDQMIAPENEDGREPTRENKRVPSVNKVIYVGNVRVHIWTEDGTKTIHAMADAPTHTSIKQGRPRWMLRNSATVNFAEPIPSYMDQAYIEALAGKAAMILKAREEPGS